MLMRIRDQERKLNWSELSRAMRILRIMAAPFAFIFIPCFFCVCAISEMARYQPTEASLVYRHPHDIKGGVRFFTDWQENIWSVAFPGMYGSAGIIVVLMVPYQIMEKRKLKKMRLDLLERIHESLSEKQN
jgi:hypothetical protein